MAASAKEKAYNLKDSYVAGLIEGGATAPAPSMPTQDMGEQASATVDAGGVNYVNDGDPGVYLKYAGDYTKVTNDPKVAHPPQPGYYRHQTPKQHMVFQQMRKGVHGF